SSAAAAPAVSNAATDSATTGVMTRRMAVFRETGHASTRPVPPVSGWVCPPRPSHYLRRRASARPRQAICRNGGGLGLHRYDRPPPMAGEAEVKFLDGDFRVIRPGAFVRCAVTGVPIPLEELKYWSVDLQEAYAGPEAVLQRHFPASVQGAAPRIEAGGNSQNDRVLRQGSPRAPPRTAGNLPHHRGRG